MNLSNYLTNITDPCTKINDCFNCTSYIKDSISCLWSIDHCQLRKEDTTNNRWYVKYSGCSKYNYSNIIRDKYCGDNSSDISTVSNQIILNKFDGNYGVPNIYCMWDISNINIQKTINFNFELLSFNPETDRYTFVIQFGYGSFLYSDLTESKTFQTNAISSITFHYFSSEEKRILPFVFEFNYSQEEDEKSTSIMVYLVLSIATMFSCLFLIVCIFTCLKGLLKDLFNNNNNNLTISNNTNNVNHRNSKRDILSHFELTPISYNHNLNEYGCICTICLENFVENADIVRLECKHLYHKTCFVEYFVKNPNKTQCPNCNITITPPKSEKLEEQTNFISNNNNNNNILSTLPINNPNNEQS